MWKTGHSLIKSKMKETGAPLAGEMSGHIFFAHDYYGFDDALYAAVRLIRAVTQARRIADRAANRRCRRWSTRRSCASRSTRAASSRWSTKCSTGSPPRARRSNRTDGARVNTRRRLVAAARLQHPGRARRPRRSEGPGRARPARRPDRRAARALRRGARAAGGALMPKLHPEPLLFCLAWAALAITAGIMASIWMGILFSAGLALDPDAADRDDRDQDRRFRAGASGALGAAGARRFGARGLAQFSALPCTDRFSRPRPHSRRGSARAP